MLYFLVFPKMNDNFSLPPPVIPLSTPMPTQSLGQLPTELLLIIAEYLDVYDLEDLIQTCRQMNTVFLPIYLKQCPGCIEHSPSQLDHMMPDGCLYQE